MGVSPAVANKSRQQKLQVTVLEMCAIFGLKSAENHHHISDGQPYSSRPANSDNFQVMRMTIIST